MFKLFAIAFAAILAIASAAPKPGLLPGAPVVSAAYSAPVVGGPLAYSSPVAYSAPLAYSAPVAYSGYAPKTVFSAGAPYAYLG